MKSPASSTALLAAIATLIVGCLLYILRDGSPKPAVPAVTKAEPAPAVIAAAPAPDAPLISTTPPAEDVYLFEAPTDFSSNPPREKWEDEIITLARTPGGDDMVKVEALLAKIPGLPQEGKVLALEHAVTILPDAEYGRYRGRLFALAQDDEMRQALMTDVLSRDDALRFPALVEMLRQPGNNQREEIREVLAAYLDKDYGTDPNAWAGPVADFVAQNSAN